MCMTLEMTYFRAELVQLIVSRSDSEYRSAEIQHEENRTAETEFSVFEF